MRICHVLFYSLLLVFSLLPVAIAKNFTFIAHFIPPFTYEEKGEIKGFAVDIVKEMMVILQHPVKLQMIPFKRGFQAVQKKANYAFFVVARRPERENTVKWVGPFISSEVYFYKKKGSDIKINTLDDIGDNIVIGVETGNADHFYLKSKGFNNLVSTSNQMQSIQMLDRDRIDITPLSELVMPEMAERAGIDINRIERTGVKLYDSTLYLVFSYDTPDNVVAEWQNAFDTLKASGKYQDIYQAYIQK